MHGNYTLFHHKNYQLQRTGYGEVNLGSLTFVMSSVVSSSTLNKQTPWTRRRMLSSAYHVVI